MVDIYVIGLVGSADDRDSIAVTLKGCASVISLSANSVEFENLKTAALHVNDSTDKPCVYVALVESANEPISQGWVLANNGVLLVLNPDGDRVHTDQREVVFYGAGGELQRKVIDYIAHGLHDDVTAVRAVA